MNSRGNTLIYKNSDLLEGVEKFLKELDKLDAKKKDVKKYNRRKLGGDVC